MEHYLLIARSVTHAQRMETALRSAGVWGTILRAPTQINPKGCSYAVRIHATHMDAARDVLTAMKVPPIHIFAKTSDGYREVEL